MFLVGINFYKLTDIDKTINMKNTFFIFMTILFYNYSYAEEACTEMACHDGLYINVPNNYKWQPGKYHFLLEMDDIKIKCSGELPFVDRKD